MLIIQQLSKLHNRKDFDCGDDAINNYLKTQANQASKKSYSQTHVLTDEHTPEVIIGFYTLTSCFLHTELQELINIKAPYKLCGLKLARMGVDVNYQKQGHSGYLIMDALHKTCLVNSSMGVQGLFLDAKNEVLVRYYKHCGFELIPDTKRHMWIPIGVAQKLIQ